MSARARILFVSTPFTDPWAGSEELWARAALDLMARGFAVSASVTSFSPLHPKLRELRARGLDLWLRPSWYSLRKHPWRWYRGRHGGPFLHELRRVLDARGPPALVVFSEGNALPPVDLLELCIVRRLPFVTIMQANKEAVWYQDEIARRYRRATAETRRCFFVSEGNRILSEKQIGGEYRNAEIVRNPVNLEWDISLPWPALGPSGEWHFASVGRLYPAAKGQDLLLEALAAPAWQERPWRLSFYGDGETRYSLEWLARKLGIANRVVFAGFATVPDIWAANHLLVMPSRFEGLPLAMVEAMLCARPVVATDVAGHKEIVEEGVTGFLADAPTTASVATALERFWDRRAEAEEMGKAAARRIRQIMPRDAGRVFSHRLQEILEEKLST
jgi:glycosyltransferase involved in cell wall biosynthesis